MERSLKVLAIVLGGAAVALLSFFGFAIWVFIPLFPAAIVYVVAVFSIKRRADYSGQHPEKQRGKAA